MNKIVKAIICLFLLIFSTISINATDDSQDVLYAKTPYNNIDLNLNGSGGSVVVAKIRLSELNSSTGQIIFTPTNSYKGVGFSGYYSLSDSNGIHCGTKYIISQMSFNFTFPSTHGTISLNGTYCYYDSQGFGTSDITKVFGF